MKGHNMGGEKRRESRDNPAVTANAMFHAVREMTEKISAHMLEEERNRAEDMAAIMAYLQPLDSLVDSLPRDSRGDPSTFLHRTQHDELSNAKNTAGVFKSEIVKEVARMLAIAIVVLITSGNWTHILKAIT